MAEKYTAITVVGYGIQNSGKNMIAELMNEGTAGLHWRRVNGVDSK